MQSCKGKKDKQEQKNCPKVIKLPLPKVDTEVKTDRYLPEVMCYNVGECQTCTRYKNEKCSAIVDANKLVYNLNMEIVCLTSDLKYIQNKHTVVWERLMIFKSILDDFYKEQNRRQQYIRPKFYDIFNGVITE